MKRKVLSVFVGLLAAVITFLIAESLNTTLHPLPGDLDFSNSNAVSIFYENQALSFWLIIMAGWLAGSILCGFLIKLLSKSNAKYPPLIAGLILTLSAVANFFALPHPVWFIVVGLLIFIPSTIIGHSLYKLNIDGK